MIQKRLLSLVQDSKKYIYLNVLMQWVALLINIVMMADIAKLFELIYLGTATSSQITQLIMFLVIATIVQGQLSELSTRYSDLSSRKVKKTLREKIFYKLGEIGSNYDEEVRTSEVVQVAVEGVDQLETYFGMYVPQFFYAMLAPITLFIVLSQVYFKAAFILFICVPLIPISIALVQKWAKKLLSRYWGQYTEMGDTFLENLQGLTTLKIYEADEYKNKEMNVEAEKFRKITMKVLIMQLNSISIMDLVAYGGSALGIWFAVTGFANQQVGLFGTIFIILLSASFFLPMRMLGSYFHIAMNGIAASDKIFRLLDFEVEKPYEELMFPEHNGISMDDVSFQYEKDRIILNHVNLDVKEGSFVAIVGESGSGKSTIASLLCGKRKNYTGSITIGGCDLLHIKESELLKNITYVGTASYLFKGTVRDNLLMGNPYATDDMMWDVLEQTNLKEFLVSQDGLETKLLEKASNLSGGQAQRLALARALLHDSPIYIFDEATSNIDAESEDAIIRQMHLLNHMNKTIVMISHRLANAMDADCIYVIEHGTIVECGTPKQLVENDGTFAKMWNVQKQQENYGKEAENHD